MLLPTIPAFVPATIIGGLLLTKFGRYKPIFVVVFALVVVGFGLFSLLDENSSTVAWVGFQIIESGLTESVGAGLAIPTFLPALLAPLTDKDTAFATGTWAFMRSFGVTWGVAVPGAIFSSRAAQLAGSGVISSDATVAAGFMAGGAYQDATAYFFDSLSAETRAQVVTVQSNALQRSCKFGMAEKDKPNKEVIETTEKEVLAATP
ncbi:hypothetical protein DL766_008925 [Monosporascus sp. MC13-8B]|uniref:Major facilitator superfamily (MFS) profile domain-containing protein n=1 Tax=Monosporascus cannonballus TaxID=155416 RepID=A0ABY0H7X3_9PEZI|nr:hypothetical protein DL763_010570 [Monosporascus cannonballus]RYO83988.1 hypothetical protein DL762_005890 [Monosporascus cannonballus]RYP17330.1 hypothetical protein DL766_008925 [Monosporascus sp. MC13-8B]